MAWSSVRVRVLRGLNKFPRDNARKITNLEAGEPEFGLGIEHLIYVIHGAFLTTGTANPEKLLSF
jgi:hypothetical protein